MNDIYQERYVKHQARKALSLTSGFGSKKFKKYSPKEQKTFFEIFKNRRSQRVFNNEKITDSQLSQIIDVIDNVPSSCDRKGVTAKPITTRDDKDLLSGLLVGGTGWCYRGQVIFLLVSNELCYKNPAEKEIMPYLDAGVVIQSVYLACEALNLGCCFVNPNVREANYEFFKERFLSPGERFCGALVIGNYDLKHI